LYTHIVSRNYRDRSSPKYWLLREWDQEPQEAKEYEAVVATGIAFCPSTSYESGFGCSTVGFCTSAIGLNQAPDLPEEAEPIRFDGVDFRRVADNSQISWCEQLILLQDGKMHAVLKKEAARETAAA